MADHSDLTGRIDAEFKKLTDRVTNAQQAELQEFHAREQRLADFGKQLDAHKGLWISRLEILAGRFKDHVKITPSVAPAARSATFEFQSPLAKISLKFSVGVDRPVQTVIFAYDLEIIPVLMEFENHATIEFPLGAIDEAKLTAWLDDRIVGFVTTYISVHENDYYLKDHMVQDPITHSRFAKFAAAAQLEWNKETYYFVSEETKRQFAQEKGLTV